MPPYIKDLSLEEERAADKFRKAAFEWQSAQFSRASAYTNVILIAGYAGVFAIWNYTHSLLTPKTTAIVGICLGLSLLAFLGFEVFKMVSLALFMTRQSAHLENLPSYQTLLEKWNSIEHDESHYNVTYIFPIWKLAVGIAVLTALVAAGLLLYNYVAILLKWPPGP